MNERLKRTCVECIHFEVCAYVAHTLPVCDSFKEEIVHCRDCQFSFVLGDVDLQHESPYKFYRKDCRMCGCEELMGDFPNVVGDDFYCGYGKRKDGTEDP